MKIVIFILETKNLIYGVALHYLNSLLCQFNLKEKRNPTVLCYLSAVRSNVGDNVLEYVPTK